MANMLMRKSYAEHLGGPQLCERNGGHVTVCPGLLVALDSRGGSNALPRPRFEASGSGVSTTLGAPLLERGNKTGV
jgi:hypothetical protein